jgi:hypothetical protein
MNNENETSSEAPVKAAETEPVLPPEEKPKPRSSIQDFLSRVKAEVSGGTAEILLRTKMVLVEKDLSERRDQLLVAINKLQELQRDGHRLKPDVGVDQFDADGKAVGQPSYSKAKLEELKKHKEHVAKVEKAIAKAFGGDFSGLKEVSK